MPKSRNRKGFAKRKRHNRLMLEHNRHGQQKLFQMMADNIIAKAKQEPKSVVDVINEEEKQEKISPTFDVETSAEVEVGV